MHSSCVDARQRFNVPFHRTFDGERRFMEAGSSWAALDFIRDFEHWVLLRNAYLPVFSDTMWVAHFVANFTKQARQWWSDLHQTHSVDQIFNRKFFLTKFKDAYVGPFFGTLLKKQLEPGPTQLKATGGPDNLYAILDFCKEFRSLVRNVEELQGETLPRCCARIKAVITNVLVQADGERFCTSAKDAAISAGRRDSDWLDLLTVVEEVYKERVAKHLLKVEPAALRQYVARPAPAARPFVPGAPRFPYRPAAPRIRSRLLLFNRKQTCTCSTRPETACPARRQNSVSFSTPITEQSKRSTQEQKPSSNRSTPSKMW